MSNSTVNRLINMVHPDHLIEILQYENVEMDDNFLYIRGNFDKYFIKQSDIRETLGMYGEAIEKERLMLKFYEHANYTITTFEKENSETFYCFLVKSDRKNVLKLPLKNVMIDAMEDGIYENAKIIYKIILKNVREFMDVNTFYTCPDLNINPEQVARSIWECFRVK